jgi:hypothetical protein
MSTAGRVAAATPRDLRFQPTMASSSESRTGVSAIVAGALIFAGQAGELVFGSPSDLVGAVFVALFGLGVAALVVAIWRLGRLVSTKAGRIGWRICVAGVVFLGLFAVQALVTVALTGDIPGNFALFALGFVLLFVGHLVIAPGLRDTLRYAWVLPLVGAAGILVAITVEDGVHDIGLFVFEGAWIALGVALVRAERRGGQDTASALAGRRE